jgi:hypothetical protein
MVEIRGLREVRVPWGQLGAAPAAMEDFFRLALLDVGCWMFKIGLFGNFEAFDLSSLPRHIFKGLNWLESL